MIKQGLTILLLSLLAYIGINIYQFLEVNKSIPFSSVSESSCKRYDLDTKGPEDITYFNEEYLITATSNMVEIWYHFKDQSQIQSGDIYLIPTNKESEPILLKKVNLPSNYKLHAHGIYSSQGIAYILNHGYKYGGERLDIFSIDVITKTATYKDFFIFPEELYGITNNLIVVNENNFFVTSWNTFTHDSTGPNKLRNLLGFFIQGALILQTTYVYHCSFKNGKCRKLSNTKGIMNNGITWNKDLSNPIAWVVDTFYKVREYKIVRSSKEDDRYELEHTKTYHINYLMDNIEYSVKDKKLYIALMGKGVEFVNFLNYLDKYKTLPSSEEFIYHTGGGYIDLATGEFKEQRFTTKIRGGSSAVCVKDKIYFGSYGDNGIVICDK